MSVIKLIHFDMRPRRALILPFPYGHVVVTIAKFDLETHWRLSEREEQIDGPVTLYLAASKHFPGYSYRLEPDEATGFLVCKCPEFTPAGGSCAHTIALESLI